MYDLKTYLRNVYELEASVYQQENGIRKIQEKISGLPSCPSKPSAAGEFGVPLTGLAIIVIAIMLALNSLGGFLISFPLGFVGVCMALGGFTTIPRYFSKSNSYNINSIRYQNGISIQKALEADLPALRSKLSETQSLLRSYYAKGILHPKYQNLIAISYLLDCIETGRHTQLEGPNGAYNQFELEVRMDRISNQLDTVITKLDQIRQNQYSLYAAITQANRTNELMLQKLDGYCRNLDNLNASTDQIRRSLDTANHTAELTRKEISYRNYLDHGSSYSY